ncbi:uncharacterized protein BJ171DRAFT_309534 [Polychytrium aggregatum]|uniref:uncharacterized protein n=1 Tax=Polychytrium aggregatum TaxID=110093 RepID=UPI0022FE5674|nr:uncharacterized protein BJ171DRAFT_309534 [Polychytrium aggregatum]KAI9206958.1 hypothetical protein BJ171DRAFT_309534 [Polychytrium aggregatum]
MRIAPIFLALLGLGIAGTTATDPLLDPYPSYQQIVDAFGKFTHDHPNLVQYRSIGSSGDGLDIPAYLFSDSSAAAVKAKSLNDRPAVFFTALTHSREPLTVITLLEAARELVDPSAPEDVASILKSTRVWFVPIVNPDGWSYIHKHFPTVGSDLRKNRASTCRNDSQSGVNLGHNWGYMWDTYLGLNETVMAADYEVACAQGYHGPEPFSEKETASLRDFILREKPKTGIFFHQRGHRGPSRIIIPYTFHPDPDSITLPPDRAVLQNLTGALNQAVGGIFDVGSAWSLNRRTIAGSEVDWTFDQGNVFSLIVQIGLMADGYWPKSPEIATLIRPHVQTVLTLARQTLYLPNKRAKPNKTIIRHIQNAALYAPVIMGLILAMLLGLAYVVARFLGYDNIWGRFSLMIKRLRWGDLRGGYRGLATTGGKSGDEDEDEDGDFEFEIFEGGSHIEELAAVDEEDAGFSYRR